MADPGAMTTPHREVIPDSMLSRLSDFVAVRMGLHFPQRRWSDLRRGITSAMREFGFGDMESCVRWLLSAPLTRSQIEILASHLTVGETYFFRDKKCFQILEEHILPGLIQSQRGKERSLRIWSAGCSTGEEAYSIAILLSRMVTDMKYWNITILATDINPRFLGKAAEGVYTEWSFRDVPPRIRERYFTKRRDGCFEILPDIKKVVTFSYHNLVEDAYPSLLNNTNAMDIIFCRNVLMYFSAERAEEVIRNLRHCLVDGGWLIVSPVEASHLLLSPFRAVSFEGATFYKKEPQRIEEPVSRESIYPTYEEIKVTPRPPPDLLYAPLVVTLPEETGEPVREVKKQTAGPQPCEEALALYEQGRYAEATEKISALLSLNQTDARAFALLSRTFANQGKLSEALEWCEKAISVDRMNPASHYLLATILQERGQTGEAVASLKRSLYLDQNFLLAHFTLGNLTRQQGKFKESRKHFENALSLLKAYRQEDSLPESEGMTAGRLSEIIQTMRETESRR